MSEQISAYITIGGTIPQRLVEPLCAAITQQKASLNWGEAHFAPTCAEDLLEVRTSVYGAEVLQHYDDEANWGEFMALEKFFVEHGIGFDRYHDAKFDTNARLTQFRPGGKRVDFNTSVEGHVVVPLRDLQYLRDELHKVRGHLQRKQYERGEQKLQDALESLARRVVEPSPPLPALEVAAE